MCHRVLPLGHYYFFCISMIFLWLVNFDTILFADDTFLAMSDNILFKLQDRVNIEQRKINLWMRKKKLQLNYSKTHYLLLDKQLNRSYLTNFNVSLNSINIKCIKSIKYLRIYIDENLVGLVTFNIFHCN